MIQIGARNMQNYSLLRTVGRARKPVLLKRGMAATVEELLMAAEYVLAEGNYQVVLCERGIRTFADHTRNTARPRRGRGGAAPLPPADHRRPVARHRQAPQGGAARAARPPRSAPTAS